MQTWPAPPLAPSILGWLIALLVLILTIVFAAIGTLDYRMAGLIGGLALARLL